MPADNSYFNHYYLWMFNINPFLLMFMGILGGFVVFIPVFIAYYRRNPNFIEILILTILFGWTGIGWLILMVWSLSKGEQKRVS